jgi:hypothetical protein
LPVSNPDAEMLEGLRRAAFNYFHTQVNPKTGLIADKTHPGSPSSIAAVGIALSVYVLAIERELLSRAEAIDRTITLLKFFRSSHQVQKQMPQVTEVSTITFSTCRPGAGLCNVNYRRLIRPYSLRVS